MINRQQFRAWCIPFVTGLVIVSIVGCGDDTGLGKRYPVYGKVTYNGKPIEKGQITFAPTKTEGTTRAANGVIENGNYTLTTAANGDGALPGDYQVTIISKEVDDSKVAETIAQKGGGGRQMDVAKANKAAQNLIPAKYQLADTSKLKATVKEESNKFDFELTD